ncbi:MAG: radical SAM protein [Kiritimatiellae bacterium]|nr:radical SAM protein [Kiritimatiellia bacterium]
MWKIRSLLNEEKFTRLNGKVVINSFLPPFPSEAFNRLGRSIHSLMEHKAIPLSAYISVTSKCRYNCWHCSKTRRTGEDMSRETILSLVKDLQEMGVCIVGFTGGEPMLREDMGEIIGSLDDRSVSILFTSGDGVTKQRGRKLKEMGLFGAAVSLDHYEPAIHDERRGKKGAFETALNAIRIFRDNGMYTMIQLVATKEMAGDQAFERYLELAGKLGVHEIRLLEPMPTGNLIGCAGKCMLNDSERATLRQLHIKTNNQKDITKVCAFAHIEHKELYGCGAGFQHLYIDAQGNVCPCDFTPVSFGNINKEKVSLIWSHLNKAFGRPGCKCFLLENADKLNQAFTGTLPIEYTKIRNLCRFPKEGELPEYYRVLGWKSECNCSTGLSWQGEGVSRAFVCSKA